MRRKEKKSFTYNFSISFGFAQITEHLVVSTDVRLFKETFDPIHLKNPLTSFGE